MTPQMEGPLEWISQNHPIKLLEPLKSLLFRPSNYSMSQYKSDWCVCVWVIMVLRGSFVLLTSQLGLPAPTLVFYDRHCRWWWWFFLPSAHRTVLSMNIHISLRYSPLYF